jgi:NAD(P)-dependent dehydrogenase (short-subunit alcohol dehydrogenase family)
MKQISGSVAAVTGAGSGIGRAVALALAAEGARVAVTDVHMENAEATAAAITGAGGEAMAFAMDVAGPEQVRHALVEIQHRLGNPRVLVNNAGIAVGGNFLDTSMESWQRIMAINLMGVVHCCRAFLPVMLRSGGPGHVVNIASMLGYTGMRGVTAYSATKFGVMGFSESLRAEMRDYGIGVSAICPGMILTNIISAGILESTELDVETRRREINALYAKRNYPPEKVARAVISAIRRNRAVVPVTPEAWAAYYGKRLVPGLVRWLAGKELV